MPDNVERRFTEEQLTRLRDFLGSFPRFRIPAKYVAARMILIYGDKDLANATHDYVGDAYGYMLKDNAASSVAELFKAESGDVE